MPCVRLSTGLQFLLFLIQSSALRRGSTDCSSGFKGYHKLKVYFNEHPNEDHHSVN